MKKHLKKNKTARFKSSFICTICFCFVILVLLLTPFKELSILNKNICTIKSYSILYTKIKTFDFNNNLDEKLYLSQLPRSGPRIYPLSSVNYSSWTQAEEDLYVYKKFSHGTNELCTLKHLYIFWLIYLSIFFTIILVINKNSNYIRLLTLILILRLIYILIL